MTAISYRNQIAEAFRAALLGKTGAGTSVHTKLDRPLDPRTELPAIMVYANRAARGRQDYGNSLITREVEVTVELAVQGTPETALDLADAMVEAIEQLIEADPTLGSVVQDTRWQRTITDTTNHAGATLGVGMLQYEVTMLTHEREPGWFGVGDDGFVTPPTQVITQPDQVPAEIAPPVGPGPCEGGTCAPPAWGGEVGE